MKNYSNLTRRSRLLLLMLFALLAGGVSPAWADELTVYDGTTTNGYVPVYGYYIDTEGTKAEYIIPTTELADLDGGTISKLTYYLSSTPSWGALEYKIFLKEVTEDNYSSATLLGDTDATVVYEGTITPASNTLDINFTTNYTYNGGNLLVGFYLTKTGSYASGYFYGKSVNNAAVYSYSGWSGTSTSQQSFIPKTTFTYTPAAGTVKKPTGLTASNVTYQGAMLSWTAGEDETEWEVAYNKTGETPNAEGSYTSVSTNPTIALAGLDVETTYYAFVRAKKGDKYSKWSNSVSFTTTERYPAPTGLAISNLTTTSATLTWAPGAANSWEVAINTNGTTPTEAGTVVNAATYDFSGLTAETTYYAFVREKDGENYSSWSAACEFTPSAYTYLTVNDGTTTNYYVPISGNFSAAANLGGQFIIPAANLTEIQNKIIKKLTFYSASADFAFGDAVFDVCVKEVSDASMPSSMYAWNETWTTVYNGTLSISGGKMSIVFTSDFNYTGSNLLIGIHKSSSDKSASTWVQFYGNSAGSGNYRSHYSPNGSRQVFQPKTTIGYMEKTGSELKVFDGETELESPASFDFGLAAAGDTHTFTLKNTAATSYVATISSTNLTVSPTELTPDADGKTFTVEMPNQSITNEAVVITPAAASGLEPFTIIVSGTVRDNNKLYVNDFSSKPTGWTAVGTWSYSAANGAQQNSAFETIDAATAYLYSPLLSVSAGEKFIIEAKGINYSMGSDYQHLRIEYSTNGTSWTAIGDEVALTSDWKQFTVTTPNDFVAGKYYIALHGCSVNVRLFYGGEVAHGANFAINTDGSTQNFGSVRFGATAEKTFTVTNSGNADLSISFASSGDFTVLNNFDASGKTLKLTDNFNWGSANVYAWDKDGNPLLGEWPGTGAETVTNDYGETQFVLLIPDGAVGLIFNNGNGGAQTEDITDFGYEGYWMDGTQNDLGHYKVTGYDPVPITLTVNAGGSNNFTVSMNTASSGDKSGNVNLSFDALNATNFTIPCTGNVKNENYLYVDFENEQFPEGWQKDDNWSLGTKSSNHYACQTSTTTASALVTTPLTVSEDKTLKFKACRNGSGTKSLKVRYSKNGGAEWSDYVSYNSLVESYSTLQETSLTVDNDAEKVIVEFLGCNIQLDDIEGFTKTTAPAIALSEGTEAVANGDTKDFGFLSANGTATYTVKNIGNAKLNATITGEGITVEPSSIEVAAGETKDVTVTFTYAEPYGAKTGKMTIVSEGWVGDFVVNFTATLVDPTDFVEDFESNATPAGWYNGGWTVSGGDAHVYTGNAKELITEKLGIASDKDVLSFDAKVYYGSGEQTLNVYTSTDRKTWSETQTFTLTSTVQNFSLTALTADSYVKFEAANATIDNLTGVKKLDAPAHDLYLVSATLPTEEVTPSKAISATVNVASLITTETVSAELYFGESKVGELADQEITTSASKSITINGTAPAAGTYDVYAKIYNGDVAIETDKVSVTVADTRKLNIAIFKDASPVQADDNNEFEATFYVTVENTGTANLDASDVSVTLTDTSDSEKKFTATWTAENSNVLYMNTKKDATDIATDCTLKAWCWNTTEDGVWSTFTNINDGFWSVDLQGKTNFKICRFNPAGTAENPWDNVWNQSGDMSLAAGNLVKFSGYNGDALTFSQESMTMLEPTMTTTLKVTVTGAAVTGAAGTDGTFTFSYRATENVSNTSYGSGLPRSVTVTPTTVVIAISEYGYATFASEYALDLDNLPNGLEVFYVTADNIHTSSVGLTEASGKVEEGTGLLVKGAKGSYTVYATKKSEADELTDNLLVGCLRETTLDANANFYVLSVGEGNRAEFQSLSENGATIPAGKAYLNATGAGSRLIINFDDVTGINAVENAPLTLENCYNLQGQKVENVKKGGLYIINGKKVVIK